MSAQHDSSSISTRWDAMADLVREHDAWLKQAIRRRFGEGVSPDDIVQEAYLRARDAGVIQHPRALLLQIASRLATDQLRRQGTAARYATCQDPSADAVAPDQTEILLLKQILAELPDPYREAFLLNRLAGLTYAEVASKLGVSVKSIEWRMSRAIAHCAARLNV